MMLEKGARLRLTTRDCKKKQVHVKRWVDQGCVCVSYNSSPLEQGRVLEAEGTETHPKSLYYVQVAGHPDKDQGVLFLRRNPAAHVTKRRRGWRLPYTSPTSIKKKDACHFLSGQFRDISLAAACILSEERFQVGTEVQLRLVLAECSDHVVDGTIVRASKAPLRYDVYGGELYGLVICYNHLSNEALRHLTVFLWRRIRAMYPRQMRLMFDTTHRPSIDRKVSGLGV